MVALASQIKITDIMFHYLLHAVSFSSATSLMPFLIEWLGQFAVCATSKHIIYAEKHFVGENGERRNYAITVDEIDFVVFIKVDFVTGKCIAQQCKL